MWDGVARVRYTASVPLTIPTSLPLQFLHYDGPEPEADEIRAEA